MTLCLCDSLEIVIHRTGHARFEWLCSDQNPDAASRAGYRALVLQLAAGDPLAQWHAPTPTPTPTPSIPARPCGCGQPQ
jgi:hypothetical protein